MNNIPEYIRQLVLTYNNDLDLRDGSALNDLLVNAGAAILTDLKLQQDQLFQYLTLQNPEGLSEETLNSFAKSFFVDRKTGQLARGYVKMYFSSPRAINIPKGTRFENTAGLFYKTTNGYSFSEADLRHNSEFYPYYSTGDIYVEAEAPGIQYDCEPGKITKLVSVLPYSPAYINNPLRVEGSTEHESNSVLYSKILNSFLNKTLYTSAGLQSTITEQFPSIQDIVVVGTDDEKMLRDMVYFTNISGISHNLLYERSDYFGSFGPVSSGYIYSGILSGPYYHFAPFNESSAYYNGVAYSGVITSGTLLSIPTSSFAGREFSLEQYAGLYKRDSSYALVETRVILSETFDNPGLSDMGWTTSDASAGIANMRYYKEIAVADGKARLGYAPSNTTESVNIVVDSNLLAQISGLINRALAL